MEDLQTYEVDMIAHVRVTNGAANPTDAVIKARKHLDMMIKDGRFTAQEFISHKVRKA